MPTYIESAFHAVCKEAREAAGWYVCLMEEVPFYGGPEEGGWWGEDTFLVAYQHFPSEEQALAAEMAVEGLAAILSNDSRREYGEHCLREMAWCEERGLEADFLPEPDGESRYYVTVVSTLPMNHYGNRQYS